MDPEALVLKPKHSGFFDTTLDTLLETLRIRRMILTASRATSASSHRE
jgi:nicotinamidase-related amidase